MNENTATKYSKPCATAKPILPLKKMKNNELQTFIQKQI